MAKTSYGYVERNLENDVNWAEVGKGFSDMLIAERDERKEKKQYLEDVFAETQAGFEKNAPIGYNTTFNDLTSDVASNSTSFAVAAKRDLQRGLITPQEFLKKMQRLNDSADVFFELGNNFNSIYEKKLNRMDKKESGGVEQVSFEAMADLTNFNNHGVTVDKNGTIVAAPLVKDKNGVVSMDVKNARSVQAVFNSAQNEVNRLDLDGEVQKSVKLLGEDILGKDIAATQSKEGLKTVLSGLKVTKPKEYNEWKQSVVERIMASDLDIASVLHDYNKIYELTTDPEVYKKNKDKYIYVDLTDGKEVKVELTQEQRDKAAEIIEGVVDSQSKSSQEETAKSKISIDADTRKAWREGAATNKMKADAVTMLGYLYAGKTQGDIEAAMTYFEGLNDSIKSIVKTENGISVTTYDKGKEVTTPIPLKTDGKVIDFDMFVKSATALTKKIDVSDALNKIDKSNLNYVDGKYVFNPSPASVERTITPSKDVTKDFLNQLDADFNAANTAADYVALLDKADINSIVDDNGNVAIIVEGEPTKTFDVSSPNTKATFKQYVSSRFDTDAARQGYIGTANANKSGGSNKKYVGLDADGNPIYE